VFPALAWFNLIFGDDALIETKAGRDWSVEESKAFVVPIVSRINISESGRRTAILRAVIAPGQRGT
jgi:hypothetical protein